MYRTDGTAVNLAQCACVRNHAYDLALKGFSNLKDHIFLNVQLSLRHSMSCAQCQRAMQSARSQLLPLATHAAAATAATLPLLLLQQVVAVPCWRVVRASSVAIEVWDLQVRAQA